MHHPMGRRETSGRDVGNREGTSKSEDDGRDGMNSRVSKLEKALRDTKVETDKRLDRVEKVNEELRKRVAKLEVAGDPLPDPFDKTEAGTAVKRLLGISPPEMPDDVKALLWTHALRSFGVLSASEYSLRKKRLLARDLDEARPEEGAGNQDAAAQGSSETASGQQKDGTPK